MTDLRDAARQALEALEEATNYTGCEAWSPSMTDECLAVAVALKAALEQPEQEPVACIRTWHKKNGDQHAELWDWCDGIGSLPEGEHLLYTYSPRREWRSLSEEEVNALWASHDKTGKQITRAIEAALKERNHE